MIKKNEDSLNSPQQIIPPWLEKKCFGMARLLYLKQSYQDDDKQLFADIPKLHACMVAFRNGVFLLKPTTDIVLQARGQHECAQNLGAISP